MAKKIYPEAEFQACDNEVAPLAFDVLAQISLLAPLPAKAKENLEKCAGAMRLRRFRQHEVICHQGAEDCTAFYIVTHEDLDALRNYPHTRRDHLHSEIARVEKKIEDLHAATASVRAISAPKDTEKLDRHLNDLREHVADWRRELQELPGLAEKLETLAIPQPTDRQAARVHLGRAGATGGSAAAGWSQWITRKLTGGAAPPAERPTISIPFDGPTDISLRTRQAILYEGELFGEMACLNRAPRSATVVAARDCYILEMLSNVLTEIDKDPGRQQERNRVYKERALDLQLRDLSIFRDLTEKEFAAVAGEIRASLDLITCKAGELICDEHEPSDCVYLVRNGLVQVKKNVSSLLSVNHIANWHSLGAHLRGEALPSSLIRDLLPAESRFLIDRIGDLGQATPEEQAEIVHGLNVVVKHRQLAAFPACQEIALRSGLHERVLCAMSFRKSRAMDRKDLDEVIKSASLREWKEQASPKPEEWSELDHRRLNRLLVEALLPGCLRPMPSAPGLDVILTYCARGDFIGEMGVCRGLPRSSTCIAFGQPRSPALGPEEEDVVQVELVRMPGTVFLSLMKRFPAIRANVEAEMPRRQRRDEHFLQTDRPGAPATPFSRESDRLGLIQGQSLMLIDMERCTMCGECVRGCVDAHSDGRSRLFLVGHRFDKYLVPMTCRSCLDPVCLIDCPVRSIQRGDNREIVIKDWCIGCQKCAKNCPYDAIKMHDLPAPVESNGAPFRIRHEIAVVCDLCSNLPDQTPRCVYACPHEAALRINAPLELPNM